MNTNRITALLVLVALSACTSPESSPPEPKQAPAPTAESDLSSMDLAVPTQDEADLEAQKSIDESNADAALDELEQEIEGGSEPKAR
jgi:hypothetical protein